MFFNLLPFILILAIIALYSRNYLKPLYDKTSNLFSHVKKYRPKKKKIISLNRTSQEMNQDLNDLILEMRSKR